MATVSDALGTWEQLGNVLVDNQWRLFQVSTISEIFRVTTTILNQEDWNKLYKSGAYIRFYYPDGNKFGNYYIYVEAEPKIIELKIPDELKSRGFVLRNVGCIFSHRKANQYSLASFARWTLKLEGLV
ncbi:hypothetical protein [Nostoc sp.]|uniref:hypothetical protein n=1 Tax=Nostoc sp. TaxID=1180 RepID=UPI002FF19D8C